MAHLSFSLFGGFTVALDGQLVTAFGTNKARALLAYLAVEAARPHRRASLANMFWPESSQQKATHNLSQTLLRLRCALGENDVDSATRPPFLLAIGQDIQFNAESDYQLDVADFLSLIDSYRQHKHTQTDGCCVCMGWLKQAADLYRGDLLAGFAVRDSVPFDEWHVVQQEALHNRGLEVLGVLADYHERRGELAQMLEYARRLIALEPWHERAHIQVMSALAQSGEEAAALEQYAAFSRILAQEFGIKASPEATGLYEKIRRRRAHSRTEQPAVDTAPPALDERRQVTALLVRWLAPNIDDPEEMLDGLASFAETVTQVSERHGGWLQPHPGTDFLVYFGYPMAQEDAARRAVRAALALIAACRDQVRIGIHTGMMVSHGAELVGNVPDLAGDCQRLAEPGWVVITADTERLVRRWFVCQPIDLGGSDTTSAIYRVPSEHPGQKPFDWLDQRRPTPMVGREEELRQLAACLDRVKAGQGQVVTVCGEPGIGKTRLTYAFRQMCAWPATWLESHCSPLFQNTSYYPITDLLEQFLGCKDDDDAPTRRAKLEEALVRNDLASPLMVRLLSLALNLPDDTSPSRPITEDLRERMREACLALLQREAARQPVMLLIEDLHWADPTTITWLSRSLDALIGIRCVLWLTWRPDFVAPWLPQPHELKLSLGPLNPQQAADLASAVDDHHNLPEELRRRIVKQADGIPLYLEELTRMFLDGTAREMITTHHGVPLPATLRDSLMARLDRTGSARETAQWAAVLGREFQYPVLRAVAPFAESRLQSDLATLVEAGLVNHLVEPMAYTFKHALIQDAAYSSLLKSTLRDIHRRIAETLTACFPVITEMQPEILAQHYSQAELFTQAADCWLRAGERAIAQGTPQEARTFFNHALAAIAPDDCERRWRGLQGRQTVFDLLEDRAAQRADIEALLALARTCNDDVRLAEAFLTYADYAYRVEDYQRMLDASEAAIAAATCSGDRLLEARGLSAEVVALARLERWEAARPIVNAILAILPEITDEIVQTNFLSGLAHYHSDVGDISYALQLTRRAIDVARRTGDLALESRQAMSAGFDYARLGCYADARAMYERGMALAETLGAQFLQTNLRYDLSYVLWCSGDRDGARFLGESALQELRATGYRPLAVATCLAYLGMILEDMADYSVAADYLAESRILANQGGLHASAIEAQAVEARCLLALGREAEARQAAAEVWAHLRAHGTVAIDFPSRVYACIADVVAAIGPPGLTAQEVVEAGYSELMRHADLICDPLLRRSFLENEVSNQDLIARCKSLHNSPTLRTRQPDLGSVRRPAKAATNF